VSCLSRLFLPNLDPCLRLIATHVIKQEDFKASSKADVVNTIHQRMKLEWEMEVMLTETKKYKKEIFSPKI